MRKRHALLAILLLVVTVALVAPARAQVSAGTGFASVVPCLSGAPAFATTSMANTLYPGALMAPASDPALLHVTSTRSISLAPIGSVATVGENSTIANGLGATYGLAYDDGSVSGIPRLFVAAYLKRGVSLSFAGLGAIWEYRFAMFGTGTWSLAAIVPDVGSDMRRTPDSTDTGMIEQVGKVGLGDLEVSPDGRTLSAMNLHTRRIARYSISTRTLVALPDLTITFDVISGDPAVQADLRPFALDFSPISDPTGTRRPVMVVGVIDSAERSSDTLGVTPAWISPIAYVMAYTENIATGDGVWSLSLAQSLRFGGFPHREDGTTFFPIPRNPAQTGTWNPWMPIAVARTSYIHTQGVRFPTPLVTDIAYTQDGQTLFVGLRDRTGDQLFGKEGPVHEESVTAQGDVLTYKWVGGNWTLQANTPTDAWTVNGWNVGDYFDDNTHIYPGKVPAHNDNLMGAVGISLSGTGPNTLREQVMATSLMGASTNGVRVYNATGGGIVAQNTITSAANAGGGKSASLGDVEYLCTYALVGGRVWQDNGVQNGVQDAGEPGFPGIDLDVFAQGGDANSPALATLTTDASGNYLFAVPPNTPVNIRIAARSRTVMVKQSWRITDPNQGTNDATDSDMSAVDGYIEMLGQNDGTGGGGVTGMAVPMLPNRGNQRDLDIGLTQAAPIGQIGDRVWDDTNHNGIQDVGEPGHPGYAVSLIPDPKSVILGLPPGYGMDSTTDANGTYRFIHLPSGRYAVRFAAPAAPFLATLRDAGTSDAGDSDADASTNHTSPFVAVESVPGNGNTSVDMGLFGGVPDVWVSKSGPAQTLVGSTFAYTLDFGNIGTRAADGVHLRDTLPAGLTYVSASPTPRSVVGQVVTWDLNTLAIGQTGRVTLTVMAPTRLTPASAVQQSVVNAASISTTTVIPPPGPNDPPGNNSSTITTTLVRPEVGITKTAPTAAVVDDEFTYTLSYANTGSIAAASVVIADTLPAGITFVRFIQNPGAVCSYTAGIRLVSCVFPTLAANESGTVVIGVKADVTTATSVTNMATIGTFTVGDTSAGNVSFATTAIQFPDPTVTVSITPSPFPVGTSGSITATATNQGTGVARTTTLSLTVPADVGVDTLPAGCTVGGGVITCDLGDLAATATDTRVIPISLPATFAADSFSVTASIASVTPELPATLADNSASASVTVIRPNVFVTAAGPTSIVGQGSVFWYTVDEGNQYRANPSLTRDADDVILTATLPADVRFVQADVPPSSISGSVLVWNRGTRAANASGQIHIVVQTTVPAGTTLHFSADISTTTPGDDLSDNHATVDTDVVPPPAEVGPSASTMRLAIHSDLDPNSQDANPTNGVYLSDAAQIAWPAGEVLDFTPRLGEITFGGGSLPFPYEYRARVVGWSVAGFTVNGATRDPHLTDSRGIGGCRAGAWPPTVPEQLTGCAYAYLGGENLPALANPIPMTEGQMATQAHVYWTQPPPPPMRPDVYLYTLDPLRSVQIAVQVEVEVWIVNAFPGSIGGVTLPDIPVMPLPRPSRPLISQTFDVTLLVPRSLIGPGGVHPSR